MLTVLMGTISVVLTTTIVNVAIPSIMVDLEMAQTDVQWLSSGFLAAMTATMLASAPIVARHGQRTTFVAALAVFIAASLLAAASWNGAVMIVARVLQGLMAGIVSPIAMVVIFQVFPDHERGRALGLYGMGVVLAPALGPTLGGVLVDVFSWRAVYLAALPFCLLGLFAARRTLPDDRPGAPQSFDWPGLALLAPGIGLLLNGLTALKQGGGESTGLPWALLAGGLCLALFAVRERRARHPLIAPETLLKPHFALACLLAMIYGAGLFGSTYLLPLLVQGVQGMSATATGLVLMPAGLALAALLPVSGRLSDHMLAHRLIIGGLLMIALGLFGLSTSSPVTGFWVLAGWILLGRLGMGLMLPALNLDALRGLRPAMVHQGSGMINFCRMLGGALGVNLFSLLLAERVADYLSRDVANLQRFYDAGPGIVPVSPEAVLALTRGFSDTFMVFGCLFVVAIVPAVAMGVFRGKFSHDSGRVRR